MKLSRLERIILLIAGMFLAFSLGWYLRGQRQAVPLRVETDRLLSVTETFIPAPAETEIPRVDLNTADVSELMTLPGIGEKRAADIVADRELNGPFRWPEDLERVKGIGAETVAGLLDHIVVKGADVP